MTTQLRKQPMDIGCFCLCRAGVFFWLKKKKISNYFLCDIKNKLSNLQKLIQIMCIGAYMEHDAYLPVIGGFRLEVSLDAFRLQITIRSHQLFSVIFRAASGPTQAYGFIMCITIFVFFSLSSVGTTVAAFFSFSKSKGGTHCCLQHRQSCFKRG